MREITLDEAALLLSEHDNFKILTHSYPDGDCLGSGYALAFILRKLGKKANVAVDGKLPSKFTYLVKIMRNRILSPSISSAWTSLRRPFWARA